MTSMSKNSPPLKVLFATPECAPWVKTGGLGEVSAALPQALGALGHDVKVLMPAYRSLQPLVADGEECARWPARGPWPAARLVRASASLNQAAGFTLLLLDCPELYDVAGGPYQDSTGHDYADNARRFAMFSEVAARLASEASDWPAWRADVLHVNDWTCGLAPAYLSRVPGRAATVITIHNLAFQGLFPMHLAEQIDLPPEWLRMEGLEYWGQLSFMKAGLQFSDGITTVSPTYAREIQDEPLGFGLQGVLRERAGRLRGILNGIDTAIWHPSADTHLVRPYDAIDVQAGKAANKAALQARVGLAVDGERMLFGVVSRLTAQKGIDLILDNVPWLVAQGAQVVALGKGDVEFETRWAALAARYPGEVAAVIGFDESLAHQIEGGADSFLMPSRFEPCGLNQMYSLAYGTPPVVHATGGLADSVVDARQDPEGATGFVIHEPTATALQEALQRAIDCHAAPRQWLRLQHRGMAQSFEWGQSARRYEAFYRELLAGRG